MADTIKLVAAVLLVAAGVAGYYALGEAALILRVLAVVAGIAAGAAVAALSDRGREFIAFAREAVVEAKKSSGRRARKRCRRRRRCSRSWW